MYGAAESQVIVRRSLSLTAALPRFARVGDKFEAGVVVTATALPVGDADVAADVTLVLGEASGPLTLTNPAATKARKQTPTQLSMDLHPSLYSSSS
jgi:uncharacterized protein YfaS (alpha-2-macroglobulin family)